jgi:cytoskeletal protein CcmA (bactofilin family)
MPFMRKKTADNIVSLLGKGAEMNGEIAFTNGLRVEGIIKGKVRSEATLEIGPGGLVDAEVRVRRIGISGEFHGVIYAADRVEIHKDGKVYGDIFSPCLIIEAGAVFDGRCNMSDEKKPSVQSNDAAAKVPESDKGK